jgi:hypothetical protein
MKLKAETSGVIKGARMVEVVRAHYGGSFVVQVACLPEVPDGIEWYYPGWFKQYIIENLRLTVRHMSGYFSNHSMTEYVILKEVGKGFLKYGFYRRIFVNSEGVEIDRTKGKHTDQNVRYINIWTGAVDRSCNYGSIYDFVTAEKAWWFAKADLPHIQYFLHAESYNRYAAEWNTWQSKYNFTDKEIGLSKVSIYLFIYLLIHVYSLRMRVMKTRMMKRRRSERGVL